MIKNIFLTIIICLFSTTAFAEYYPDYDELYKSCTDLKDKGRYTYVVHEGCMLEYLDCGRYASFRSQISITQYRKNLGPYISCAFTGNYNNSYRVGTIVNLTVIPNGNNPHLMRDINRSINYDIDKERKKFNIRIHRMVCDLFNIYVNRVAEFDKDVALLLSQNRNYITRCLKDKTIYHFLPDGFQNKEVFITDEEIVNYIVDNINDNTLNCLQELMQ